MTGIYDADLAEIPHTRKDKDRVVFVDDNTLITVADTFKQTHKKIQLIVTHRNGIAQWSTAHNTKFDPAKYQMGGFFAPPGQAPVSAP
jgi:phosphoketolase